MSHNSRFLIAIFIVMALLLAIFGATTRPTPAHAQGQNPFCNHVEPAGIWQLFDDGTEHGYWELYWTENARGTHYESQYDCLMSLAVEQAIENLSVQVLVATDVPTETPTTTPDPTETVEPTATPTELPTETPVVTQTPSPEPTALPTTIYTLTPVSKQAMTCARAWHKITETVYEVEIGYRYFDKHTWCQSWLMREHGIDYTYYKVTHPILP